MTYYFWFHISSFYLFTFYRGTSEHIAHAYCIEFRINTPDFLCCQVYIHSPDILLQSRKMARAGNGHNPRMLVYHPRQCDLRGCGMVFICQTLYKAEQPLVLFKIFRDGTAAWMHGNLSWCRIVCRPCNNPSITRSPTGENATNPTPNSSSTGKQILVPPRHHRVTVLNGCNGTDFMGTTQILLRCFRYAPNGGILPSRIRSAMTPATSSGEIFGSIRCW